MQWDWNALGPLGVFLTTIAGGVTWVAARVDKSRKEKRDEMLTAMQDRLKAKDERIAEQDAEIQQLQAELKRANHEKFSWYWQLRDNGIEPIPPWREPDYV